RTGIRTCSSAQAEHHRRARDYRIGCRRTASNAHGARAITAPCCCAADPRHGAPMCRRYFGPHRRPSRSAGAHLLHCGGTRCAGALAKSGVPGGCMRRVFDLLTASRHPSALVVTLCAVLAGSGSPAFAQKPAPAPDALTRLNEAVDALTRKVWPSVVQIMVTSYGPREEGGRGDASAVVGRQRSIGSGFVI